MNNRNEKYKRPPWVAEKILNLLLPDKQGETPVGDFREFFDYYSQKEGRMSALIWYWREIIKIILGKIENNFFGGAIMVNNYMKTSFRNMRMNKGYSFINILGLAIGMATTILILLWVQDELSFDRFHENADSIYRVSDHEQYSNGEEFYFTSNAAGLGPVLKEENPEIENFARMCSRYEKVVKYKDQRFNEKEIAFADPSFLELFTFPLVKGNKNTVLKDPNSILITEAVAIKYFGDEDPIGKTLNLDNHFDFQVTGILKNIPNNSHVGFDFLLPFKSLKDFGRPIEGWTSYYLRTYVKLVQNVNLENLNAKISDTVQRHDEGNEVCTISLMPLTDIHLNSGKWHGGKNAGDMRYVYLFVFVAIFILATACINFMNLATARAGKRAKEIGLRKTVGAGKSEIIRQFYSETILFTFLSMLISIFIIQLILPLFNTVAGKELSFNLWENYTILIVIFSTGIITSLVAGSYPALILSSFRPVQVLRGSKSVNSSGSVFRKTLVSIQFILTISLIIGTLGFNEQFKFIRNKKLGYDKEQIIYVPLKGELQKKTEMLKTSFSGNPDILNTTAVSDLPPNLHTSYIVRDWDGKTGEDQILANYFFADENFLETMNIELAEGNYFRKEMLSDTTRRVVLNQAAVKAFRLENPIGKMVNSAIVIGVVKDFHTASLRDPIRALTVFYWPEASRYLLLKITPGNIDSKIESIEKAWAEAAPNYPLEYHFLDEYFERQYKTEQRIENVINAFTFLALFIACLGLFGMASYTAEQRTKEIGIRKVLGSSVAGIVLLLSKEFTKWIILANLIAWPVSYYFLNSWLAGFEYRTELGLWMFFTAAGAALLIAIITVSYQAIRAALANPVDSLKYE